MRLGFGVALLLAATIPVSALADNIVSVDLSGTLPNSSLTSTFTLNLNDATTSDGFIFSFSDPAGTVNGMGDPLTVNISQSFDGNTLELTDGSSLDELFDFTANGSTLFFDPSVPSLNPGTYSGIDFACTVTNEGPGQALPATLAMLQMTPCAFQLVASSVTPEPTSIALFATGLLGVGGIVRRRYLA